MGHLDWQQTHMLPAPFWVSDKTAELYTSNHTVMFVNTSETWICHCCSVRYVYGIRVELSSQVDQPNPLAAPCSSHRPDWCSQMCWAHRKIGIYNFPMLRSSKRDQFSAMTIGNLTSSFLIVSHCGAPSTHARPFIVPYIFLSER